MKGGDGEGNSGEQRLGNMSSLDHQTKECGFNSGGNVELSEALHIS